MRNAAALALVVIFLAPSVPAAGPDGPHLLVRILNEGETVTARVLVRVEDAPPFFDEEVELPQGERVEVRVDSVARHIVRVEVPRALQTPETPVDPLGTGGPLAMERAAFNEGCPGPYGVDFSFDRESYAGTDNAGCRVRPPAFEALLAEARAARSGVLRASVDVPLPGSADRGVYDHAGEMPFAWHAHATWLDAWGRETRGAEVEYLNRFGSAGGSGGGALDLAWSWAQTDASMELYRFEAGATRPTSWTRTQAEPADGGATATAAQIARQVRYDDPQRASSCLLRHALQGRTVRVGDVLPAEDVCPLWGVASWRAAAPIEWNGLRALPLYQLVENDTTTHVARVLLVDGVAYFAHHQRFTLPADGVVLSSEATLERLEPRGEPIAFVNEPRAPATLTLASLDSLRGPLLSPGAFGFTLVEAVEAARALEPRLGIGAFTARSGAALVGAAYGEQEEPGAPLRRDAWVLVFADGERVERVACERLTTPAPLLPPISCRVPRGAEWGLYAWSIPVLDPPSMTRADLPARAASFDDALARWHLVRPDRAEARPTFALYRTWAEAELGEPALVAVGIAPPYAFAPALAPSDATGDHAALLLADGSTYAAVQLTRTSAAFAPDDVPGFGGTRTLRSTAPMPSFAETVPYLAGGSLALGLLALLAFLLYSRLARARVLDDATRARIVEVVAAEPGVHASGVMERIGKQSGVGEYHLDVLVREGFLTAVVSPGFRRYFVAGRYPPTDMRAIAALREGQNGKLFAIIRARPGIHLAALAQEAGVSVPYASKGVKRLAEAGLVDKVQIGRTVELHVSDAPALS